MSKYKSEGEREGERERERIKGIIRIIDWYNWVTAFTKKKTKEVSFLPHPSSN